ncbi:hypothetical protein LEM8419_01527 [Neolewinella maritima]|uniref:Phosphatidic acid phosphatase type 2/haloperoxidase domain-containing protein n=1 Tax=Neolewinella maritima TaxID=1383882 RepID=A0ABM9B152_9BACT|nr:phosphatase PAP2 family protein [Neolewinella maritima]CAH1000374.1 hypothetical protein LEM8419_01527 [Neolewinella maritima]
MDQTLFELINQQLASPLLDAVLPVYREKTTWIPLYAIWLVLLLRAYGWKRTLFLLLCIGAVIAVADQIAASVLKPWVAQLRPCAEPSLAGQVRELVGCGGRFGFPSNHATNHFAVAVVLCLTWVRGTPARIFLLLWAASIGLAQVYVGKHYPSDVLAGACLGTSVAILGVWAYRSLAGATAIGPSASETP